MATSKGQGRQRRASKRSYARISLKRRKMLIQMVFKDGFSIARAIKKLGLKLTTARFIIQKYKQNGTFPMKQFKKNARMLRDLPWPQASFQGPHVKLEVNVEEDAVKVEQEQKMEGLEAKQQEALPKAHFWYCYPFLFW